VNPTGPKTGEVNVARGGCHGSPSEDLRSAARAFKEKGWHMHDPQMPKSRWWLPQMDIIGFRVARTAE
jgi:formylglycine-generating enzyme required for sulfatase activity